MLVFRYFIFTFALVLAICTRSVVLAHSEEPRLEISVERSNPGGVVEIRGVNFGMDETVTLTLLGSGAEILVGESISNGEGEFNHIAVLPTDLAEGAYHFRATTSHHWALSPPLTVWGTAVEEGGGQGPRDEDDGLLAPMPTFAPALATRPAPVVSAPVETPAVSSGWITNVLFMVALMVLVAAVLLMLGRKRTA